MNRRFLFIITVLPLVLSCRHTTGIQLDQESIDMFVQDEVTLEAFIDPDDATNKNVIWTCSNSDVVILSTESGERIEGVKTENLRVIVKAIGSGEASITVQAAGLDYPYASCPVKVSKFDADIQSFGLHMPGCHKVEISSDIYGTTSNTNYIVSVRYGSSENSLDKTSNISELRKEFGWTSTFDTTINELQDGTKYYYQVVVTRGKNTLRESDTKSFETLPSGSVDLDLPSGNLWRSSNVGADEDDPLDHGNHYAWGDSGQHNQYDWTSYKWSEGSNNKLTKYCPDKYNGYNGYTDSLIELEKEDDVAQIILGEKWRTPSLADIYELIEKCIWTEFSSGDVTGYIVSSKKDENNPKKKIFLPFGGKRAGASKLNEYTGYYWTTSFVTNNYTPYLANCLEIIRYYTPRVSNENRCYGLAIRPVAAK